jgi:hypothetical protein
MPLEPSEELRQLIAVEKASIDREKLKRALIQGYQIAGGSLENLRRIVQVLVDTWVIEEISKTDLPGPDQLWIPVIREKVALIVGKKFDELTQLN